MDLSDDEFLQLQAGTLAAVAEAAEAARDVLPEFVRLMWERAHGEPALPSEYAIRRDALLAAAFMSRVGGAVTPEHVAQINVTIARNLEPYLRGE